MNAYDHGNRLFLKTRAESEARKLGLLLLTNQAVLERDVLKELPAAIAAHFPFRSRLEALDLGSDHGLGARVLTEMGARVTMMDLGKDSARGVLFASAEGRRFDLIHDYRCLQLMTSKAARAEYLAAVRDALSADGVFVLKTEALNPDFDLHESFESLRMDCEYVLYRETPKADVDGLVEKDGRFWIAQKKIAPSEMIRQELRGAGFTVVSGTIEAPRNRHAVLRLVLKKA